MPGTEDKTINKRVFVPKAGLGEKKQSNRGVTNRYSCTLPEWVWVGVGITRNSENDAVTLLRSGERSVNKQREREFLEKATNGAKALGLVVTERPPLTQSREEQWGDPG